jgi:hypothetical protein
VIQITLDGIHNILKTSASTDVERVCSLIEECGGLDKIESLQNHENIEIYKIAYEIIESYFSDDAEEDPSLVPETVENNFQFDPSAAMPGDGFNF